MTKNLKRSEDTLASLLETMRDLNETLAVIATVLEKQNTAISKTVAAMPPTVDKK